MDIVTGVELECSYGAGDGRTRSGVASMPKERSGGPRLDWSCDWEKYGYDKGSNPLNENDMESGSGGPPTPLHPMESQFYGSGDRLYRNYHPKLTGNVTDFNIKFSVY